MMFSRLKTLLQVSALGALVAVAGCGLGSQSGMNMMLPQGDSFSECLAREYQDRAEIEAYRDVNWSDAAIFLKRMNLTSAGENIPPLHPDNFAVAEHRPELERARALLIDALGPQGGIRDRGCACAKAQRYYDGWIEQASDNKLGVDGSWFGGPGGVVQPGWTLAERAAFYEYLLACQKQTAELPAVVVQADPEPITGDYAVYFAFDKSDLTPEAKAVIREVVALIYGADTYSIDIVGHTDTVGTVEYNIGLGHRRANSVENFLLGQGVSRSTISTSSRGKSEPAVQTGDQVREPRNRRAIITVTGEKN